MAACCASVSYTDTIPSSTVVTSTIIITTNSVAVNNASTDILVQTNSHSFAYTTTGHYSNSVSFTGTSVPSSPVGGNSCFVTVGVIGGLLLVSVIFNITLTVYVFIKWKINQGYGIYL